MIINISCEVAQTETNIVLHRGVLNKIFKIKVNTMQVQAWMCFLLSHRKTYNFSGNGIYSKRNILTLCETRGLVIFTYHLTIQEQHH